MINACNLQFGCVEMRSRCVLFFVQVVIVVCLLLYCGLCIVVASFLAGGDGGWDECVWSVRLGTCFSPSYIPLRCAGGACGRIVRGKSQLCPSCSQASCAACLDSGCGWCSRQGFDGIGSCMVGGLQGETSLRADSPLAVGDARATGAEGRGGWMGMGGGRQAYWAARSSEVRPNSPGGTPAPRGRFLPQKTARLHGFSTLGWPW